jgi:cell division protein FtsB
MNPDLSDNDEPVSAAAEPRARRRVQSAQETRERRRRLVTWCLSFGLVVLFVNAVIGENGYLATLKAEREKTALEVEVARLRHENSSLQQDARRLESDPAMLEETARREFGLIRPGETLVIIRDVKPAADRRPQ